jgi:hypothetical protein
MNFPRVARTRGLAKEVVAYKLAMLTRAAEPGAGAKTRLTEKSGQLN